MASSSFCFVVVSVALLLQYLVAPASAMRPIMTLTSTDYIDKLCTMSFIDDKPFCLQTLSAYPPAASASDLLPLATAVISGILLPLAQKSASFAEEAAQKDQSLQIQFKKCKNAYESIGISLMSALRELKDAPEFSNYDVMVCTDKTKRVTNIIGKNQDVASKALMDMTKQMGKLLRVGIAATQVLLRVGIA